MSEMYAANLDALQRAVVPTYGVVMARLPDLPRPSYLADAPAAPPQSVAEYRAALAKLGKLGIVKAN